MIMNKGKTVIAGTPDMLREKISGHPTVKIELESLNNNIVDAVQSGGSARNVTVNAEDNSLLIVVDDAKTGTPEIVREIVNSGGLILSVNVVRPSLEEAYLKLIRGN
jgi:ABC-2 type transport system ATP-binding protein